MTLCECGCGVPVTGLNYLGLRRRFVHGHNARLQPRREGSRRIIRRGYAMLRMPEHPRADETGYVYEHWIVAERAFGRPLPAGVIIHHANEDRADNRNGNLAILPDIGYHMALHHRLRVLRAGGNPFTQSICKNCGVEDTSDFYQVHGGPSYRCKECTRQYARDRRTEAA